MSPGFMTEKTGGLANKASFQILLFLWNNSLAIQKLQTEKVKVDFFYSSWDKLLSRLLQGFNLSFIPYVHGDRFLILKTACFTAYYKTSNHRQATDHWKPTTNPPTGPQPTHGPLTHWQVFNRPTDHRLTDSPTVNPLTDSPPTHRTLTHWTPTHQPPTK